MVQTLWHTYAVPQYVDDFLCASQTYCGGCCQKLLWGTLVRAYNPNVRFALGWSAYKMAVCTYR